jgi:hypothetical protein
MASVVKSVAVTSVFVLVSVLMACGTSNGNEPPTSSPPEADSTTGGSNQASSSPPPTQSTPPQTREVVLAEGHAQQLCGINVGVKFIPPSQTSPSADQAFLVAAPGSDGDQPSGTVAPAFRGAVATLMGMRFEVLSVDTAGKRVSIRALC